MSEWSNWLLKRVHHVWCFLHVEYSMSCVLCVDAGLW